MKRSRIRARAGKAAPVVFAVLSLVGLAASVVSTARKAPEIKENLEKAEEEKGEELTMVEKIKAAAPSCVEPAIFIVATGVVIVLGSKAHFKAVELGTAASGAAYLWHSRFKKMEKSVKDRCGDAALKDVKKDVAEKEQKEVEVIAKMNKSDTQRVKDWYFANNKDGAFAVWEPHTKQTIVITKERLLMATLHTNRTMSIHGEALVNDFVQALGGARTNEGLRLRWSMANTDQMDIWDFNGNWYPFIDPYIDILNVDGSDVLAIFYDVEPDDATCTEEE